MAAILQGPRALVVHETEEPHAANGEILVDVELAGIFSAEISLRMACASSNWRWQFILSAWHGLGRLRTPDESFWFGTDIYGHGVQPDRLCRAHLVVSGWSPS